MVKNKQKKPKASPPVPDTCEPLKAAVVRGDLRLGGYAHGDYPGLKLPAKATPEIRTVGAWDAKKPQHWGLDWHCNEGIEFTFLLHGHLPFATGGKEWMLRQGHFTVTRPWQPHRVGNPAVPASHLCWFILDVGARHPHQAWHWPDWLVLSPADLCRLTDLLRHNEQPVWSAGPELGRHFHDLAGLLAQNGESFPETRIKLRINEILVQVLDLLERKNIALDTHLSSTRRAAEMFLATLPQKLAHPWTLVEMAHACGLGRSQFSRYVRELTGRTPIEHLTHLRLEAAEAMLAREPKRKITDIALACGFGSGQYFATVFKRNKGKAPREGRDQPLLREGAL